MQVRRSRLLEDSQLERLHNAAVGILENMGMKIECDGILDILDKKGARVNKSKQIVKFPKKLVEKIIEMQRRENRESKMSEDCYPLPRVSIGGGGTCPLYYDYNQGDRRQATEEDLIRMIRLGYSLPEVGGINPPLIDSTCPIEIEPIKSIKLLIENAAPKAGGVDLFFSEQVEYLAEMGRIFANNPARFLPHGNCPTSPLIYSKRIAELALAKAKYHVNFAVPTMPISGVNAPITRAGTIIIGVAEILGGWVMAKSIDEETPVSATVISGVLDMATGMVTFDSPEVIIQDIGVYEVVKHLYGGRMSVYVSYVDAKKPGMQAIYEKTFKQMAFIPYTQFGGHDGSLANAKVFSPTQLMLDIETNEGLCQYLKGMEVNDEEMAVDVIKEINRQSGGYLSSQHTLRNFRKSLWFPRLMDRTEWRGREEEKKKERHMLERAETLWREAIKKFEPPDVDASVIKALDEVVKRAENELVGKLKT